MSRRRACKTAYRKRFVGPGVRKDLQDLCRSNDAKEVKFSLISPPLSKVHYVLIRSVLCSVFVGRSVDVKSKQEVKRYLVLNQKVLDTIPFIAKKSSTIFFALLIFNLIIFVIYGR